MAQSYTLFELNALSDDELNKAAEELGTKAVSYTHLAIEGIYRFATGGDRFFGTPRYTE